MVAVRERKAAERGESGGKRAPGRKKLERGEKLI